MKKIITRKDKIGLIEDIVKNPFEKQRYSMFLKVIGGELFEENSSEDELIGELREIDPNTKEVKVTALFVVKYEGLNPGSDKRRIQRSHISTLLKNSYPEYTRALVAFYSPGEELWRLSLLEVDDAFKSEEVTPIMMNSHIMGCSKRSGATLEMVLQVLDKPKKKGLQGIDLVFDQEKLLEGFFKEFREKFLELKGIVEKNKELTEFIDREGMERDKVIDKVSKKIITQFIVLYFIEKKGWLGAEKDSRLEEGDKNFIWNFYRTCSKPKENFYEECLKPIFYKGFSSYRDKGDYMEGFDCKIPYFNIKLFKPYLDTDGTKRFPEIGIKNDFFYNNGDGILDFFDRYYFSLVENEPTLKDMVVDPEMLGKVFENLLDVGHRKSKGTYYTPRIIVHFMCKETLINYLYNHMKKIQEKPEIVPVEKEIKDFVYLLEYYWDEDKNYLRTSGRKKSEILKLPKCIYLNLDVIEDALKKVKVIEPSTGSGAFLLGMLGELFKLRKIVRRYKSVYNQLEKGDERVRFPAGENYLLKASIIESNLYGVDLESDAVETSDLRFWISLMADSRMEDKDQLIDYKKNIFCGNSVTMDWQEKFAYALKGEGFDIVIGNPPYVGEKGNKDIFREIVASSLGKRYYKGKGDLFYFFFHLGLDILNDKGTLAYITTNYYITADGAFNLRTDMKKRSNILQMIDFNEVSIFSKAKGQHNIITVLEKSVDKHRIGKTALCEITGELKPLEMTRYLSGKYEYGNYAAMDQDEFYRGEKNYIYLEKSSSSILEKVSLGSVPLKTRVNVNQGLVSGADKVTPRHIEKFGVAGEKGEGIFSLSTEKINDLNLSDKEMEYLGMFFKNSHIDRYICEEESDRKIIYLTREDELDELPEIREHLERFKSVLENKREARKGMIPWYSLHWPREKNIFLGEKIVAPQRSRRNVFAYNDTQWYASADVYYITLKKDSDIGLKYITALLNSKLYYVWLYKRGKRKGELLELYATPLEELPVKVVDRSRQADLATLVDEIRRLKRAGEPTKKLESKIDDIVCDIYNLTDEEKEEIYSFYEEKLER